MSIFSRFNRVSFQISASLLALTVGTALVFSIINIVGAYQTSRSVIFTQMETQADTTTRLLEQQAEYARRGFAVIARSQLIIEALRAIDEGSLTLGERREKIEEIRVFLNRYAVNENAFDLFLLTPEGKIEISALDREWQGSNINNYGPPMRELVSVVGQLRNRFDSQVIFESELFDSDWVELTTFPKFSANSIGFMIFPLAADTGQQKRPATGLLGYLVVALDSEYFGSQFLNEALAMRVLTGTGKEVLRQRQVEQAGSQEDFLNVPVEQLLALKPMEINSLAKTEIGTTYSAFSQPVTLDLGSARPWYVYTFVDENVIFQSTIEAVFSAVAIMLIAILCVGAFAHALTRWIGKPLEQVVSIIPKLRDDSQEVILEETERQDEFGELARALMTTRELLITEQKRVKEREEIAKFESERQDRLTERIIKFDETSSALLKRIRSDSDAMLLMSQRINELAVTNANNNRYIFDTINRTGSNVDSVAGALDQIGRAFASMNKDAENSTQVIKTTKDSAETVNRSADELTDASENIGAIVGLIQDIASQVNLLALNATIESARAGRAGSGFAVVAAEVKNLAGQTTEATEDISNLVNNVQDISRSVAKNLGAIRDSVDLANSAVTGILGSINEQSRLTRVVSTNIKATTSEVDVVRGMVSDIETSNRDANRSIAELAQAADQIGKSLGSLSSEIQAFLFELQTA